MKRVKNTVALMLAMVFVLGSIPLSVSGEITGGERFSDAASDARAALDYARADDSDAQTVSARVFLNERCGVSVTEAEGAYLDGIDAHFSYSDAIPSSCLSCRRIEGGIEVTASEYGYTTSSGVVVRYLPVSAEVAGDTQSFPDSRVLTFRGLEEGKTYEVTALYETTLVIPHARLDAVFNAAYKDGSAAIAEKEAYTASLGNYLQKSDEYAALYAAYLEKQSAYEKYLSELAAYETQKSAYDEYLVKKAAYEAQKKKYDEYLVKKAAYESALAEYAERSASYDADYKEYLANKAALDQCAQSITVLESVFWVDETNHSMYKTIQGSTVSFVLSKKSELVTTAGVDEKDVDGAGDATDSLRSLLQGYKKCKTDYERFNYYQEHYVEIKNSFIALYMHLNSLYRNSVVEALLVKYEKINRYMQFLAHLYLLCCCFDDMVQIDLNWSIRNRRSKELNEDGSKKEYYGLSDLLSEVIFIKDTNRADPSELSYPEKDVVEPVLPELPTPPEAVAEPKKTWAADLEEPTKPVEPEKPINPGSLEDHAGKRPTEPAFTDEITALMNEIGSGALRQRTAPESVSAVLSAHARKSVAYAGSVTVRFYDADRKTLLYSKVIEKDADVSYGGKTPAKEADKQFTYTFKGFVDEEGRAAAFTGISEDVDYFAYYASEPILYQIEFIDHYGRRSKSVAYGETPETDFDERPYTENGSEYRFVGFRPAVVPVTGNAVYTAVYEKVEPGFYTVVFSVNGLNTSMSVPAGQMPSPPEVKDYIDETRSYTFTGWQPELKAADSSAVYTAQFATEYLVPYDGASGGARVISGAGEYSVLLEGGAKGCDISTLLARAAKENKDLRFTVGESSVVLPAKSAGELAGARLLTAEEVGRSVVISLTDGDGEDLLARTAPELRMDPGTVISECRVTFIPRGSDKKQELSFTVSEEGVTFKAPGSGAYAVEVPHTVTPKDPSFIPSAVKAYPGEAVVISVRADLQAKIGSLKLTLSSGETRTVLSNSFVMPDEDVVVEAVLIDDKLKYTVTFFNEDGSVLLRREYGYNEPLVLPESDPVKPSDREGYEYSFIGWDPAVIERVIEDCEYRPVFKEVQIGDPDVIYISPYNSDRFISKVLFAKVLPFFLAMIMLISGTVTTILLLRGKNHEKREKSDKN